MLTVEAEAKVPKADVSAQIELPSMPLLSFSEAGLIGQEQFETLNHKVKKGQTMSGIFTDLGLSQALLLKIIKHNEDGKRLTKVMPGTVLNFKIDAQKQLKSLQFDPSDKETLSIVVNEGEVSTELVAHELQTQLVTAKGSITHSLFGAGKQAGLTDKMVMQLAHIFSWDIDFVLEIRQGDSFSLIYEKVYKNGEYITDGKILAASFTNQGKAYEAVYFESEEGDGAYYAPNGRSMKKAFLRAPLNFSYISSNFNPRRKHPITKRIKAHRGIDYRAPKGTPVFAAGNGKVIQSSYNKFNGNYVFVQHPNGIVTKYLHFSKRAVKKGARVKQGQTIGYVGSTGMSTASHLHYEFVYNGVHRNPRTVSLPKAEPLAKNKMPAFERMASPLLAELSGLNQRLVVAN
ncbi:peptidoglycan DD-metalloendopeptidase family protein [Marinicella rhabdoformis]|uniref:peptidoglycan DD-metalloendopeptidase family protein n=1 Tax=Marinicella rhabdoformis TaxID=2580566 RepID=UPI0012AEB36E|nr:peptidoglycan DD-metalloendopeptidase family protein [Marinicella rhabdoformis]